MRLLMKRWIACVIPWIAAVAWAQTDFQSATVQFTYQPISKTEAFRAGDSCYVTPKLAKSWDWNVTQRGEEYEIQTEGRTFRLPIVKSGSTNLFSLNEAARYLGAVTKWEGSFFRVMARIRNLEYTMKGISVDTTVAVKPKILRLSNPDRLVVDLLGASLDAQPQNFPAWWRISQYATDCTRIVIEHPASVAIVTPNNAPSRQFELVLPEIAKIPPDMVEGPVRPAPGAAGAGSNQLQHPKVAEDSAQGTLLTVTSAQKFEVGPAVRYVTPTQIELSVLNARFLEYYEGALEGSRWVTQVSTYDDGKSAILRIVTSRPMAFSSAASGNTLRFRLTVPPTGPLAGRVFVLDPGHGGKDPGTTYGKLREKDLVVPIAHRLREMLIAEGASVVMTRDGDTYPSLGDRAQLANRSNAAAFISIHVNSIKLNNGKSGGMTFYHKQDPINRLLAECIQSEIAKVSNIPNLGAWSDSRIYKSGFKVLRDSNVPSVLIEIGFINHNHDRAQMTKDDFPDRIAQAVVKGIELFLGAN